MSKFKEMEQRNAIVNNPMKTERILQNSTSGNMKKFFNREIEDISKLPYERQRDDDY